LCAAAGRRSRRNQWSGCRDRPIRAPGGTPPTARRCRSRLQLRALGHRPRAASAKVSARSRCTARSHASCRIALAAKSTSAVVHGGGMRGSTPRSSDRRSRRRTCRNSASSHRSRMVNRSAASCPCRRQAPPATAGSGPPAPSRPAEQELVQVRAERLLRQAERRTACFLASTAVSGVSLTNCWAKPLRPAISGVRSWVAYCRHAS
jgi:hypothetical protein